MMQAPARKIVYITYYAGKVDNVNRPCAYTIVFLLIKQALK